MRKSIYLLGVSVMVLASCTQNEVIDVPASRGIGFETYVGKATRSMEAVAVTPTTLETLKDGFHVYGSYDDKGSTTPVYAGDRVYYKTSGEAGSWICDNINFWNPGATYKFAAYAPYDKITKPTFDYTTGHLTFTDVTSNLNNQYDFVVAEPSAITAAENNNAPVQFKFLHALSRVKITLSTEFRDGIHLGISDFKITGINTQGDFTSASTVANGWTNIDTPAEFTAKDATGDDALSVLGDTYTAEFIVIPQNIGTVTVSFTASLTTPQGQPVEIPGTDGNTKEFTVTLPTTNTTAWLNSNCYNYKTSIGGDNFGLQPIQFSNPEVGEWITTNPDIPVEPQN